MKCIDNKGAAGALMTDMNEAFDSHSHNLLIAKLSAYGMDMLSLKLIHSYLNHRNQRVRVYSSYSLWSAIISGLPQGAITTPYALQNDIGTVSNKDANIAKYADDITPYALQNDIGTVIKNLESDSANMFQWFAYNAMKANPDKSHLLLSSKKLSLSAKIDGNVINNENNVKLLGITFDNDLS